MSFIPRNPDYARRVQDSFARQGAMRHIGAEIVHLAPGEVDLALAWRSELAQQHGYFHGGVVGMLADSAGGYAAFSLMPEDASVLTVEYKMNLLAPADGARLVARGRVLKPGRTLVVSRVDVAVLREGQEHFCATLLQTLMTLAGRSDGPQG